MDRQRTTDDIKTIRDLLTLFKGGEKAKFYCEGGREGDPGVAPGMGGTLAIGSCGKNLTDFALKLVVHDGKAEDYFLRCPRCGRTIYFSAPWIYAAMLQAQAQKENGQAPAVGTFPDVKGAGTITERPLPDGRKLIIATPRAAVAGARVPR